MVVVVVLLLLVELPVLLTVVLPLPHPLASLIEAARLLMVVVVSSVNFSKSVAEPPRTTIFEEFIGKFFCFSFVVAFDSVFPPLKTFISLGRARAPVHHHPSPHQDIMLTFVVHLEQPNI